MALLALLGSSLDSTMSRDRLVGLLWPESDEVTARHLLADSVYILRQTLGPKAIVASGEDLRLNPEIIAVDVPAFRQATAARRWREALALYRGHFLDGLLLRNAGEFEHWADRERTRLRHDAAGAAAALAANLAEQDQAGDAVPWAERALELAPYDETAFRQLFELLIKLGNRSRAEATARSFIEQLQHDLEVTPSLETMEVIRRARGLHPAEPIVVVARTTSARHRRRHPDLTTRNLTLQGRYLWHRRTRSAVERAIDYFTRATERNPHSAEAWSGLADSWTVL
ncbi:MAG: BTAD domain-containing putative transcriptional regulator, partial [Gemmatimonadota bacterium]